jgi:hypothetical protein
MGRSHSELLLASPMCAPVDLPARWDPAQALSTAPSLIHNAAPKFPQPQLEIFRNVCTLALIALEIYSRGQI